MLKLSVLCVLVFAVANGKPGLNERIVGASIAKVNKFPHQASIRNRVNSQHICGAAIVHKKYCVTAASCMQFTKPDSVVISVGTHLNNGGGTEYAIDKVIMHPLFSDSTWQNDIALLKTKTEIVFNSHNTSAIKLPTQEPPPGGDLPVVISGWGQFTVRIHLPFNWRRHTIRTYIFSVLSLHIFSIRWNHRPMSLLQY